MIASNRTKNIKYRLYPMLCSTRCKLFIFIFLAKKKCPEEIIIIDEMSMSTAQRICHADKQIMQFDPSSSHGVQVCPVVWLMVMDSWSCSYAFLQLSKWSCCDSVDKFRFVSSNSTENQYHAISCTKFFHFVKQNFELANHLSCAR